MTHRTAHAFTPVFRVPTFRGMIELDDVVHEYRSLLPGRGSARALNGVSLRLNEGGVVGLVGVNGAGKTTLIRILLGFLRPHEGRAAIGGLSPRDYVQRFGIGYVPERVAIPARWTVEGALRAYGMMGDAGEDLGDRVARVMSRLGLEEVRQRLVGTLSKGNLQRLAVAQALLGDRRLLVLDEPTDGLDPVWIAELRAILRDWREADPDRVAIVATHDLHFLERAADRVVMLHEGRMVADLVGGAGLADGALEASFLRHARATGSA